MGLDVTHDCWHGSYSAFNRWRTKLAEVAGYGNLEQYPGFSDNPTKDWSGKDPLELLLHHSDCDGEIKHKDCLPIALRLKSLLPALEIAGNGGGHIQGYKEKTEEFIAGLELAHEQKEDVEFQ